MPLAQHACTLGCLPSGARNAHVETVDRVCTKHIDQAMLRLEQKKDGDGELSVVERILAEQTDRKLAYVLALDLILVGIDTVRGQSSHSAVLSCGATSFD